MIAAGIGLVALVMVVGMLMMRKPATTEVKRTSQLLDSQDENEVIPTVGPEVKVKLVSIQPKKEVKLVVEGVPDKTSIIEYEFTYSTKEQESEGVFSTAKPKDGATSFPKLFERQITLGTCSKNVCRYHNITSDVVVRLKFEGEYGSRLFEKSFSSSDL